MNSLSAWSARGRALVFAALGAGILALATLPVAARLLQDEAGVVTIERKFEKDSVDRYRVLADVSMNGPATNNMETNIKLKVLLKQTVKEVKPDGSAIVVNEAEEATAAFGDQETDAKLFFPRLTQTLDKRLALLESKAEKGALPEMAGGSDLLGIFSHSQTFFFPEKPVKVGDEWEIKRKAEKDSPAVTGKANVVKAEKVGDLETLVIKVVADMTIAKGAGGGKSHMAGTANLDTKSGKLVKMQGNLAMEAGPAGKTKADITLTLLQGKEAEKAAEKKDVKPAEKPEKP
jgi:hypothetical protein